MTTKTIDYYSILGISEDAGGDEIRTAYKAKCFELHPDKNINDPTATAKFQDLLEAYTVLRDPEKRRMYDAGEDLDSCTCPECGRHHQGGFRSFFAQFFNSQFGGFNSFFEDDDDDRYERYQRNFWKNFASRDRFAADWHSIPPTPSERELRLKAVPDKPSKPKAVLIYDKIKIEWAKKAPRKIVQQYSLEMKKGNGEFVCIYVGPDKEHELNSVDIGVAYHFRVKAGNESGFSDYSDITSVLPVVEEPPKAEEEVNQMPGKKKKKKKTIVKSKATKFVEELNEAISIDDEIKIEKLISQGNKLGADFTLEVRQAIEKATAFLACKQRTNEINSVRSYLAKAIKSQNTQELQLAILSTGQFLKRVSSWKESQMDEIRREYSQAIVLQQQLEREKEMKEQLLRNLDQAISARNLGWLSGLIKMAKDHGVAVKHAKKVERLLIAEDQARKQLVDAVNSGDVRTIQDAINFIVNKPFQLRKELEYARSVLKLYEEPPKPIPLPISQENQQLRQLNDVDSIFLERFGMTLS